VSELLANWIYNDMVTLHDVPSRIRTVSLQFGAGSGAWSLCGGVARGFWNKIGRVPGEALRTTDLVVVLVKDPAAGRTARTYVDVAWCRSRLSALYDNSVVTWRN
jgi:hypothetical protein